MGCDDDRLGHVCMSTATWLFAAGPSRGKARRRRVLGPVGTGPRLEPRSGYRDLGSFPLHRLCLSAGGRPRRGVRCCAERCARPLATFTSRGPRRQTAGMEFGAALGYAVRSSPSSFDSPVTSSSRAVASLLRRTGVDVCRLHVRSPGPWLEHPRALASLVLGGRLLARSATRD